LVCQICGKKSGYYPLCAEHFQMRDQGLVVKCEECGKWHLKAEGCSICKQQEPDSNMIMFDRTLLENWGKKLFHVAKMGEGYAATNYDLKRYDQIMMVSGEFHDIWKDLSKPTLFIQEAQLKQWSTRLESVARDGLLKSDDKYDIGRYSDVREIAEEMADSMELTEIPEPNLSSNVAFVKDREILPKLLEMIDKAERTILIASPWIWGIKEIEEKLTQIKEQRNVTIKILTRRGEDDPYHEETVRGLHKRKFGIETADHLHAKIVIVDDKELYIGSANLIGPSLNKNLEAGIFTNDPGTVSQALVYFDEAYSEAFERRFTKSKR
jgi:phosphatidylserine/phosphatidylglycerophosphate/cardiolipin synthase-like enzyme